MNKRLTFLLFILILAFTSVKAQPGYIISNSAKWQDVYSSMLYSNLINVRGYFLVSARHSSLLISQLGPDSEILLVSSRRDPYAFGYKSVLESKGHPTEEIASDDVNLELASRLDEINKYIIVDDAYGYNSLSVASYAVINRMYVLFANRRNINKVYSFLANRDIDELLIYGQVDREVKDRLAEFDPEIISTGNRFDDNLQIVEKYQEVYKKLHGEPRKQAIFTNGEFIESEIMSGVEPVVFIGRANVPDQVREYIPASDIDIGILIGNELIGTATYVRRQLGISVFVKFAQSARQPTGPISAVEDLDRFYLPRYILDLDIYRVRYNRLANRLEVTYENKVDLAAYLKGTITLMYGDETQTVGDIDPVFIDKGEFKTIVYDIDPMSGNITAEVFTIYGEAKNSLEYSLRKTLAVEIVEIADNSMIEISRVMYDKRKGQFLVEVVNTGEVDVFVDLELVDILINDELVTYGTEGVVFIQKGDKLLIPIDVIMTDEDIENNPRVRITAYFGERERSLINVLSGEYEYTLTGFGYLTGQIIKDLGKQAVVFGPLIVIIILLILILGMKKKCPHCGEINNLRSSKCKKCGGKI
ncbi:hypothetical protein JW930_07105 [Candidatus Woesearchaeota archaeon]|nr:hypothetical protein [Candidatus Woesearchaeota archaeon]